MFCCVRFVAFGFDNWHPLLLFPGNLWWRAARKLEKLMPALSGSVYTAEEATQVPREGDKSDGKNLDGETVNW